MATMRLLHKTAPFAFAVLLVIFAALLSACPKQAETETAPDQTVVAAPPAPATAPAEEAKAPETPPASDTSAGAETPPADGAGAEQPPAGAGTPGSDATVEPKISSPAFPDRGDIPVKYTAQGENISPPITFDVIPPNAKSLALVMDDPDAPGGKWTHWIVFNIPPDAKGLDEGALPAGALVGANSWGKAEYGGPDPPSGKHQYMITLYVLDKMLDVTTRVSFDDLNMAMWNHVTGNAYLSGFYEKGS